MVSDLEAINLLIKIANSLLLEREIDLMGYELEEKISSECLKCGKSCINLCIYTRYIQGYEKHLTIIIIISTF
jgi:hypothetical protein